MQNCVHFTHACINVVMESVHLLMLYVLFGISMQGNSGMSGKQVQDKCVSDGKN